MLLRAVHVDSQPPSAHNTHALHRPHHHYTMQGWLQRASECYQRAYAANGFAGFLMREAIMLPSLLGPDDDIGVCACVYACVYMCVCVRGGDCVRYRRADAAHQGRG
jgi:hypothetical protein